jgi:hypothetical protein
MPIESGLSGKKDGSKLTNEKELLKLSSEYLRSKINDPNWLPSYDEVAEIIDSYSDDDGHSKLDLEEENKWFAFLKDKVNPVFEIWTKEYIERLSSYLSERAVLYGGTAENPITILEVGAGDGKLSHFLTMRLKETHSDAINLVTTSFQSKQFNIPLKHSNVETLSQKDAILKYKPNIILCSWMMPREDWTPDFRSEKSVLEYILIGPEGPCGNDETWSRTYQELENLSEVQISRIDILHAPSKVPIIDFISKTVSFRRTENF